MSDWAARQAAPPRAVLLDIDGTLLDSNDAHAQAWERALREHGHFISYERVRVLIGKGGDKLLPELTGLDAEGALGKTISERRKQVFLRDLLPTLAPCPGARPLVERLLAEGLRLVVATSAGDDEVGALLKQAGVDDLIELVTTKDDAASSKPDPDIVESALKRARADAENALMLGDTPYDVAAAKRAGVPAVAVRSGGWTTADLRDAVAIYDDAAAIVADFARSPFVKRG